MDMHTLLYLKWTTNKVLLYRTGSSAQCYMAAWMGGESEGNGHKCMYGWVALLPTCNYPLLTVSGWMDGMRVQSCLTLWDPMDGTPPGSPVYGISQTRILEWVAISCSRGSFQPGTEPLSPASPALAGRFFTIGATWEDLQYKIKR